MQIQRKKVQETENISRIGDKLTIRVYIVKTDKGRERVTISKICKQSGVSIAEYVEWLTLQAKPKLISVEVVEQEQTPSPVRTEISITNGC